MSTCLDANFLSQPNSALESQALGCGNIWQVRQVATLLDVKELLTWRMFRQFLVRIDIKAANKDEKVILRGDLAVILVTYNRLLFRAIAKSMACKCLFQATSLSA